MIIFGSDQEVAGLMRAVKRQGVTGKFSWIGSDGWSARALVSEGKSCPLGPSMDNSSERIAKLIWEFMTSLSAFLRKPSKIQILCLQVEVSKIFTFLILRCRKRGRSGRYLVHPATSQSRNRIRRIFSQSDRSKQPKKPLVCW